MAGEEAKTGSALNRCKMLAERSDFDLRLAFDAARLAGLPYSELARLTRARREIADLLKRIKARSGGVKG